ncbi:MAG: hypothetical protein A2787_03230 [Omnitrophica WOR_2 bacterium RIFCSPHIGHO2_01_FULL_48_9]|nr:MAG: hypothetical protein A3D10_01110 [Omnitrophica WOR_2 bacterium RIFCSPHIGHO2_02_FULL_48_11]OGX32029.1 MAG: hypothetical protein A2787_03230 [Omnitrophica WOR_2 bacterium RIFCSPHIGHO2_01_FULL_48_9]
MDNLKISVLLERDDFKMEIIGRDARNIRCFEQETGVKVVIDDTPQRVFLVGTDLPSLENARRIMEKLVRDKKITEAKIKEYKKLCSE